MSSFDDLSDRVLRAVGRMPGYAVAALVLFFYPGVGLALPLALNWPRLALVETNVLSTMLAGLAILGWLGAQLEAAHRRHLVDWTTDLRRLNAEEFEWLVGEVFHREGWEVKETGHQDAPDGNIDLVLSRDRERLIVQCKRTHRFVNVHEIREFAGTLVREGSPMNAGIFVTLSKFNKYARAEAEQIGITLVDNRDLHDRIDKVRRPEPCPICQRPMVFDRSPHGWWFHCVSGCPGKRHLGKDAGRAVEFLAQPPVT
jgi:HJR/Mrr/RecB family endonuclease